MNYKLYLIEPELSRKLKVRAGFSKMFYVENNDSVFRYYNLKDFSKVDEHFYNTRLYTDFEPFAEFNNKKDLFDLIHYLVCDVDDKRYKEALTNERLYEYFI